MSDKTYFGLTKEQIKEIFKTEIDSWNWKEEKLNNKDFLSKLALKATFLQMSEIKFKQLSKNDKNILNIRINQKIKEILQYKKSDATLEEASKILFDEKDDSYGLMDDLAMTYAEDMDIGLDIADKNASIMFDKLWQMIKKEPVIKDIIKEKFEKLKKGVINE